MPNMEYQAVAALPEEEKERVKTLEQETEQLYRRWTEMSSYWDEIYPYLKRTQKVFETEEGEKVTVVDRATWQDIMKAKDDEALKNLLDESKVMDTVKKVAGEKSKAKLAELVEEEMDDLTDAMLEGRRLREEMAGIMKDLVYFKPKMPEAKYVMFRLQELARAQNELARIRGELDKLERAKVYAQQRGKPRRIRILAEKEQELHDEYHDAMRSSPEAYFAVQIERIKEMQQVLGQNGRIVETPYVKEKIARILDLLHENRPVFIHGELGSGKSELAKHICRRYLSQPYLERWEQGDSQIPAHPKPDTPENKQAWVDYLNKMRSYANPDYDATKLSDKQLMEEWQIERQTATEPMIISGYRGIEMEQILGGIKIERGKVPSPGQIQKIISQQLTDYAAQHADSETLNQSLTGLSNMLTNYFERTHGQPEIDKKEQRQVITAALEQYRKKYKASATLNQDLRILEDAWKETFKNPVETRVYFAQFYKAMQEGRPVIIDEMNAIPHHVLIALNDLLTAKPGDKIKPMIDDAPPFTVKKGFAVIATGNWKPEDGALYIGRQPIDAAFLSRFALDHYDYLPMARDHAAMLKIDYDALEPGEADDELEAQRISRSQNELFHLLLVRNLDRNLGARMPSHAGEKLYKLAEVARVLQDVFSGRQVDKAYFPQAFVSSDTNPHEILKENVLSIRHLIPVIDKWKKDGYVRPLDEYLYLDYVNRSAGRPDEMKYIYQLMQTQGGFFPTEAGWPDGATQKGLAELNDLNIIRRMYGVDSITGMKKKPQPIPAELDLEYYSNKQIMELMFGELPPRQNVLETALKETDLAEEDEDYEAQEIRELMAELEAGDRDIVNAITHLESEVEAEGVELDVNEKTLAEDPEQLGVLFQPQGKK